MVRKPDLPFGSLGRASSTDDLDVLSQDGFASSHSWARVGAVRAERAEGSSGARSGAGSAPDGAARSRGLTGGNPVAE